MPRLWDEIGLVQTRLIDAQAAEKEAWRSYSKNSTGEKLLQWRAARETVNRLVSELEQLIRDGNAAIE